MTEENNHQKIAKVRGLRIAYSLAIKETEAVLTLLDRGAGAREMALAKTKLQEAKHWASEALVELGHKASDEAAHD